METKNLFQRINCVMSEVDYVRKEDKRVNNQYTFVSHDSVTSVLHGPCTKHGLVVIPSVVDYKQDGNRTEITIEVTFINIDKPEERHMTRAVGYGIDQQDKGPGKAYSYAFKMALLKSFMLESGEEDNESKLTDHKPVNKQPTLPPVATKAPVDGKRKGVYDNAMKALCSATTVAQIEDIENRLCLSVWTDLELKTLTEGCRAAKELLRSK
jgi:hypothetical protein